MYIYWMAGWMDVLSSRILPTNFFLHRSIKSAMLSVVPEQQIMNLDVADLHFRFDIF